MALIGKIRSNLWLVIILLGLALLSFLVMDIFQGNGGSLFGNNDTTVGSIGGEEVDMNQFNTKMDLRYNNSGADQFAIRQDLWNNLVNESIVKQQSEKLGLSVSDDEWEKLTTGASYSQYIRNLFQSPGQPFDQKVMDNYLSQIEGPNATVKDRNVWQEHKERARTEKLQSKLTNLVSSSVYAPTWLATKQHNDQNDKADFSYIKINFDQINKDVALTDADYKTYINDNKARFVRDEPQQTISYVTFDVVPTVADSAAIRNELSGLKAELASKSENNLKKFVGAKQGKFVNTYFTENEVSPALKEKLFSGDVGNVYGPMIDGNNYVMAKLINRQVIPDSVSARHILIPHNPDPKKHRASKDTIELIQAELAKGVSFDSLALRYSADASNKAKGGDLGTFDKNLFGSQAAQPFNNYCFFEAKPGDRGVVETTYGIHLVEVLKQDKSKATKGVKVAYITRPIVPSNETVKTRYAEAAKFAAANTTLEQMKKSAIDANLDFETSTPLGENAYSISSLGSGNTVRNIVKWANENPVGKVNASPYQFSDPVRFYKNKYVVAAVASKDPAGVPSVAALKSNLAPIITNQKKGEALAADIKGKSLEDLATQFEANVETTKSAFNGNAPSPELIAAVFKLKEAGQTTEPVVTPTGVYVAKLNTAPTVTTPPSTLNPLKSTIASRAQQSVYSLIPALKKQMNVKDKRNKFF